MRIKCPYCGERALDEFTYLGDASVTRPDPASPDAAAEFYTFAYERRNIPGPTRELWYHQAGCHSWLVVTRDTRSHEISDVKLAEDVASERIKRTAGAA